MLTAAGTPLIDPVGSGEAPATDLAEAAIQLLIGGDGDGNQFLRGAEAPQIAAAPERWRDSAGLRVKESAYSVRLPSKRAGGADTVVYVEESQRFVPILGSLEPVGGARVVRRVIGAGIDTTREQWTITTRPGSIRLGQYLDSLRARRKSAGPAWEATAALATARLQSSTRQEPLQAVAQSQAPCVENRTEVRNGSMPASSTPRPALLLQHGITSNNCAWAYVAPTLANTMNVAKVVVPSTASLAPLVTQALALGDSVTTALPEANPWGANAYRFTIVAHSQGGLIARTVAHWSQEANLGWMAGVVTLDTPNEGALIAQGLRFPIALGALVAGAVAVPLSGASGPAPIAGLAGTFALGSVALRVEACQQSTLYCEIKPGSELVTNLNAAPAQFRRTAIVHHVRNRWSGWRWVGDIVDCQGQRVTENCGGPRVARRVESVHHTVLGCAVLTGAFGFLFPKLWVATKACAMQAAAMETSDQVWRAMVANHEASDGFIARESQWYPGVPRLEQFEYSSIASHAGLLRRDLTEGRICRALVLRMQISLPLGSSECPRIQ